MRNISYAERIFKSKSACRLSAGAKIIMKILYRITTCLLAAVILFTGFGQSENIPATPLEAGISSQVPPIFETKESTGIRGIVAKPENEASQAESSAAQDSSSPVSKVKFADTIDLTKASEKALYIPFTSIAELMAEIEQEKEMSPKELEKKKERDALIGSIGIVNVSRSLNVREDPDGDADIIGKLYQNTGVYIVNFAGEEDEWVYVSSGSVRGWVVTKYLVTGELTESLYEAMSPRVATLVCEAKVFSDARDDSTLMVELDKGKQFPVLGYKNDYVKVQLSASSDGYIETEYVSINEGLFCGRTLEEEEEVQDEIDLLEETRRIMIEEKKAAEEAAKKAAAEAAAKKKAAAEAKKAKKSSGSSSSSKKSGSSGSSGSSTVSSEDGWKYLGRFRVTFYCVNCNSPRGSRRTASGARAKEGTTCAVKSSQIPLGSTVKVSGFGTWTAQDTGVGRNQIDLFVDPDECDGLYYRDVWIKV